VEERGRYSNLPASRLHAINLLLHPQFATAIRELTRQIHKPKK